MRVSHIPFPTTAECLCQSAEAGGDSAALLFGRETLILSILRPGMKSTSDERHRLP